MSFWDHGNGEPRNLIEALQDWSQRNSEANALSFLDYAHVESITGECRSITYGELDRRARVVAARLQRRLAPGERALLLFPPGLDFLIAFFGCLHAGVIAVPSYPPRRNRPDTRVQAIAQDCNLHVALSTAEIISDREMRFSGESDLDSVEWIATESSK